MWSASDDSGAVSYVQIFRNNVLVAQVLGNSYTDFGLLPATAYTYLVRAIDGVGNFGDDTSAGTTSTVADTSPPTTPDNLTPTAVSENSTFRHIKQSDHQCHHR